MIIRHDPLDGARTVQYGLSPVRLGVLEYEESGYWLSRELEERSIGNMERKILLEKVLSLRRQGFRLKSKTVTQEGDTRMRFWRPTHLRPISSTP